MDENPDARIPSDSEMLDANQKGSAEEEEELSHKTDEYPDVQFLPDSELILAIKRGSEAAWAELCRRQIIELLSVIIRYLASHGCKFPRDHAEDIAEETWLSILKNIHQLEDANKFKEWRDNIARNQANAHLKRCIEKQNSSVNLEDLSLLPDQRIPDLVKVMESAEEADRVLTIAESFSPKFALLLILRIVERLSWNEIAGELGENEEKLRTFYSRCFRKLLDKLGNGGG